MTVRKRHEAELEVADRKKLRFSLGVMRIDRTGIPRLELPGKRARRANRRFIDVMTEDMMVVDGWVEEDAEDKIL